MIRGLLTVLQILKKALSDVLYVQKLSGEVRRLVVGAYIQGFHGVFVACIVLAGGAFVVSVLAREHRL